MRPSFALKWMSVCDKVNQKQAGSHLASFWMGLLVGILTILALGFGAIYFFVIAYDDDYVIVGEPTWTVEALNRAQQAYFLRKGSFAVQISDLQGSPTLSQGHRTESEHYIYSTQVINQNSQVSNKPSGFDAVINYGVARKETIPYRFGLPLSLYSVVGGVFVVSPAYKGDRKERVMLVILCQSLEPSNTKPAAPQLESDLPICGSGTKKISY